MNLLLSTNNLQGTLVEFIHEHSRSFVADLVSPWLLPNSSKLSPCHSPQHVGRPALVAPPNRQYLPLGIAFAGISSAPDIFQDLNLKLLVNCTDTTGKIGSPELLALTLAVLSPSNVTKDVEAKTFGQLFRCGMSLPHRNSHTEMLCRLLPCLAVQVGTA